jgi:hypothetical protein
VRVAQTQGELWDDESKLECLRASNLFGVTRHDGRLYCVYFVHGFLSILQSRA